MAWGFLDWVRGRRYQPDPNALTLPHAPSNEQLCAMTMRLLQNEHAFRAYTLLERHAKRTRPILENLLRTDDRFRSMDVQLSAWTAPIFEVVLDILTTWHSDSVITELLVLAESPDPRFRRIAARLLAETGEARFAPILLALTHDADLEVQKAVGHGIGDVIEYGRQKGRLLDEGLVLALYEFLLRCALRTDRGPGNRFPGVLFRVDPVRAARDFEPERVLTFDRNWLLELLKSLREQRITIPSRLVRSLLDQAKAALDRPDFELANDCSSGPLTEELLTLLAETDPAEAQARIAVLRAHRQAEARKAAQRASERLLKIDPFYTALLELEKVGSFRAMRPEYRVVYLVHSLCSEVCNGGWLQWVANSDGVQICDTVEALRAVKAFAAITELQKVLEVLGPDATSSSQKQRMVAIDRMMNTGRALPDESIIWQMENELRALMYDYAARHPNLFGEPASRKRG